MSENVLIAIIGIIGSLLGAIIGFFSNAILQSAKAKSEKYLYISKTQYDLEMEIYKKLSEALYRLLLVLNTFKNEAVTPSVHYRGRLSKDDYVRLVDASATVKDILLENAAFIPEPLFSMYMELNDEMNDQFWAHFDNLIYEQNKFILDDETAVEIDNRFSKIDKMLKDVNHELRCYLSKIRIPD